MKLEKITHDHLLTKWLKVIIFALLMLAPIFSIAVRCAYVVCNKNAYQSYYGETINERLSNNIDYDKLTINTNYNVSNTLLSLMQNTSQTTFNVSNVNIIAPTVSFDTSNANQMRFYVNSEGIPRIYLYNNNTPVGRTFDLNTETVNIDFTYLGGIGITINETLLSNLTFSYYTYNQYSYLDNVFDYSVNQLRNDQLFNWTQNTGVYTGVNAMTTGLGMTDGTIAILLTYWMLLTIIYVIIDIVLAGFTMLTHMIYNKKVD